MMDDPAVFLEIMFELGVDHGNTFVQIIHVRFDDLEFVPLDTDKLIAMYAVQDLFRGSLDALSHKAEDLIVTDIIRVSADQVGHDVTCRLTKGIGKNRIKPYL